MGGKERRKERKKRKKKERKRRYSKVAFKWGCPDGLNILKNLCKWDWPMKLNVMDGLGRNVVRGSWVEQ